jgi:tetratricopeptide (TPR) repeat protein
MSESRKQSPRDLRAFRHLYLDALEMGDLEAVAALWQEASHNPELERVLTKLGEELYTQEAAVADLGQEVRAVLRLHQEGKGEQALRQARQAMAAARRLQPLPDRPEVAVWLNMLAALWLTEGQFALAEEHLLAALAIGRHVWEPNHPNLVRCLHNLALLYDQQGKPVEAERDYRRALALLGPDQVEMAVILSNLGSLCAAQGRLEEAEEMLWQSIELRGRSSGEDHPDLVVTLRKLAAVLVRQGRPAAARILQRRAEDILGKAGVLGAARSRHAARTAGETGSGLPADVTLHGGQRYARGQG